MPGVQQTVQAVRWKANPTKKATLVRTRWKPRQKVTRFAYQEPPCAKYVIITGMKEQWFGTIDHLRTKAATCIPHAINVGCSWVTNFELICL